MSPDSPIRQARQPPQHVAVCAVAQPFTWTARSWPVMYIQDGKQRPPVIAYADITIIITSTSDLPKLERILHHSKRATGALINTEKKSAALRLELQNSALKCCTSSTRLKVRYLTVAASSPHTLQPELQSIKCLTQAANNRELCCIQHVQFMQIFLLS
jgi:hypothetical protein